MLFADMPVRDVTATRSYFENLSFHCCAKRVI